MLNNDQIRDALLSLVAQLGPPAGSDPKVLKANATLLQDAFSCTVDQLETGIEQFADKGDVGMLLRTVAQWSDDIDVSNQGTTMGLPMWEPSGPFSKVGSANIKGLRSWISGVHTNTTDPDGEFVGVPSPTNRKAYVELSKKDRSGNTVWVNARTGAPSPFGA